MASDPKNIILKILEIIDYKEDKEKYASQFLALCEAQALSDLTDSLPLEEKDNVHNSLKTNPKVVGETIEKYFTNQQIQEGFKKAIEKIISNYIQTTIPTLSENQKTELDSYINSLKATTN